MAEMTMDELQHELEVTRKAQSGSDRAVTELRRENEKLKAQIAEAASGPSRDELERALTIQNTNKEQ